MIKSIIIDDEPKARLVLRAIIEQYCPQVIVLEECADLPTGVKAIKKNKPDLVFLDIEMPGHSGLELLDFFSPEEVNFGVIFTTAYNEYAIQAFKFSAIDYLLKPIQHLQLMSAISRYEQKKEILQLQQITALQQNLLPHNKIEDKRLVVPVAQSYKILSPQDILMIKGDGAYSEIFMKDGSSLIASKNLKFFEDATAIFPFFLRTHKSYLVNVNFVKEYVKSDGGYLKLTNNIIASIATDKVDTFLSRLV
jgi:two-component system, LytTR family, response regulator